MLKIFQKLVYIINYLFSNTINEKKFIKTFFKKSIVYLDVGANMGSEFDFISNINVKIKKAYLIEPSRKSFEYLKNKYNKKNIEILNIALSDKIMEKKFYEYNVESQSSFYNLKNKHDLFKVINSYKAKTQTIDSLKIKKIDYLKIDAQDEDLQVLKGAIKMLKKKHIKLIKIEIAFNSIYKSNSRGEDIINFLNQMGYNLVNISLIKFEKNRLMFFDAFFE